MNEAEEQHFNTESVGPFVAEKGESFKMAILTKAAILSLGVLAVCASLWLAIACSIKPDDRTSTDFFTAFYPSAKLAAEGQYNALYPSIDSTDYDTATLTRETKALFPSLSDKLTPLFPYPPIVALFLIPVSFIGPQSAFILVTVLSILAIALSYLLLSGKPDFGRALLVTFLSLSFGPIFQNLSLGQLSIFLGVFVISLGYRFCLRQRHTLAGLVWSFLIIKPILIIAPALIAISLALNKQFKLLGGMILGSLSIIGFSTFYFSPTVLKSWLHLISLLEQAYLHSDHYLPLYMVIGLSSAVTAALPETIRLFGKYLIYALILFFSIAFVAFLFRQIKADKSWSSCLPKIMVASIFFSPIAAPYMRFYDLSILWVAVILILENQAKSAQRLILLKYLCAYLLVIEVYFWMIMTAPHWQLTQPLLFLTLLLILEFKIASRYLHADETALQSKA